MLSEREGCTVLADVFGRRGYAIARDVVFDEDGVRFVIDGWDAAARTGFEYRTHEAADRRDLTDEEILALGARMERGELFLFIIDDLRIDSAASLRAYAERFLDEVARRRAALTRRATPRKKNGKKATTRASAPTKAKAKNAKEARTKATTAEHTDARPQARR